MKAPPELAVFLVTLAAKARYCAAMQTDPPFLPCKKSFQRGWRHTGKGREGKEQENYHCVLLCIICCAYKEKTSASRPVSSAPFTSTKKCHVLHMDEIKDKGVKGTIKMYSSSDQTINNFFLYSHDIKPSSIMGLSLFLPKLVLQLFKLNLLQRITTSSHCVKGKRFFVCFLFKYFLLFLKRKI